MQLFLWLMSTSWAVKESDFRTHEQTLFCQRMAVQEGFKLVRSGVKDSQLLFELEHGVIGSISVSDSILRVFMDEPGRDRFHYDAFKHGETLQEWTSKDGTFQVGHYTVTLTSDPFEVYIQHGEHPVWTLSNVAFETDKMIKAGLLTPPVKETTEDEDADDETYNAFPWSYSFNGHTDRVPKGPAAIKMTVTMHGCENVYGLPERTGTFRLQSDTHYRLYNLDVFEYAEDSPMGLYGTVPMLMAPKRESTLAMLWNNPSETWIHLSDDVNSKKVKESVNLLGTLDQ